jgi:predicted enzyme related to lactoylglutathione lyase
MPAPLLGLRTVIYPVTDLAKAKEWYQRALGLAPYFDQPFYVGFQVGGYELGLDPDLSRIQPGAAGSVAYWGVEDIKAAWAHWLNAGATASEEPHEVGGGIWVATVKDPFGNLVGLIQNPHFQPENAR